MGILHENLFGIDGKRAHEKIIDKNKDQNNDHRAYVKPPHFVWGNIPAHGLEHGLCQVIKDHRELIEGGNPDPGQNHTKQDDEHVDSQDDVECVRRGQQKIRKQNHFITEVLMLLKSVDIFYQKSMSV
jgi:hypothetical protein